MTTTTLMRAKLIQNPLIVIFFTVFVDLLGFGILIPVIPQLLANPASAYFLLPKGWTLDQGYILLGYLTAVFPFMQFLATPILGQLSDKFGRKKVLAISLAGTSLSYILFAIGIITKNLPLLFFSRGFDGVTGGNISVAQAAIADVTTPENRAKNFGLIGAAFGLGFILGPYIGGKLSDPSIVSWFNASTPFWFAAILSFVNVLSVIFFFPETIAHLSHDVKIYWGRSLKNIGKAFSSKQLLPIFATSFLFQAGFTFFTTFFSIYLINKFHFSQGNIGDYFSYVGIWIAFTQAVVLRKLSKIFSESQILSFSIIACGTIVLAHFLPQIWWQLLLITPFFAITNGLTQANIPGLISRTADAKSQGETLGISSSVQALAQAIPPVLSGYIAANLSSSAPLVFSSVVILFAGAVFLYFYQKPESNSVEIKKEDGTSDVPIHNDFVTVENTSIEEQVIKDSSDYTSTYEIKPSLYDKTK